MLKISTFGFNIVFMNHKIQMQKKTPDLDKMIKLDEVIIISNLGNLLSAYLVLKK
jgi:hypothetical protein